MNKLIIVTILALTACSDGPESVNEQAMQEIVSQFKGNEEPAAIDAIWTSPKMFKVAVGDDGSNRDGYARYACSVLNDHGMTTGYRVEIVDIQSVVSGSNWVELGSADCG